MTGCMTRDVFGAGECLEQEIECPGGAFGLEFIQPAQGSQVQEATATGYQLRSEGSRG